MIADVAIIGGGPAGLACAIGLRLRGLSVIVREKRAYPIDKACGEGVMARGLAGLRALGVRIPASRPIVGIRYINEDGRGISGSMEAGAGIRRIALSQAMYERAIEVGVMFGEGEGKFTIAADGLHSTHRAAEIGSKRWGQRQHYAIAPWTDHVEIYFAERAEAYVTPVSDNEVGVALLWRERVTIDAFPLLKAKIADATATSAPMARGPLEQRVDEIIGENFALVGDAAGYVDAITGEGISLALDTAAVLVDEIARKRTGYMTEYAAYHRRAFAEYALLAKALLGLAAVPRVRRFVVAHMGAPLFERALRFFTS